jgi:catechol 2,3-dioxygenase-like lactoylglutathione lyase family enzyme
MIDHLGIQAADVDAAAQFYTGVLAPIGIVEAVRIPTEGGPVVGLAGADGNPGFWLSPNVGGGPPREDHIAFAAADRGQVDAVHEAAVAAGVEVLHAPREWPEYHPGYYAVFLRDPDGHNVEAVTHH